MLFPDLLLVQIRLGCNNGHNARRSLVEGRQKFDRYVTQYTIVLQNVTTCTTVERITDTQARTNYMSLCSTNLSDLFSSIDYLCLLRRAAYCLLAK
jgi:hypothetical protein